MRRIKHARRTRAGAIAYADVCVCTTLSSPNATRVRAATHVYDPLECRGMCVCVCITFNILYTQKYVTQVAVQRVASSKLLPRSANMSANARGTGLCVVWVNKPDLK